MISSRRVNQATRFTCFYGEISYQHARAGCGAPRRWLGNSGGREREGAALENRRLSRQRILEGKRAAAAGEVGDGGDAVVGARNGEVFPSVEICVETDRDQRRADALLDAALGDVGALYVELIRGSEPVERGVPVPAFIPSVIEHVAAIRR